MKIAVVSTGLREKSQTAVLANRAFGRLKGMVSQAEFIDLRETPLPFCDGGPSFEGPQVKAISRTVSDASGVLIASPIYNYDLNSAAKNFLELTGASWKGKVVAIICTAGGRGSYMAPLGFINSLMLDFRCIIVPRYVFVTQDKFSNGELVDRECILRVDELVDTFVDLTGRLNL